MMRIDKWKSKDNIENSLLYIYRFRFNKDLLDDILINLMDKQDKGDVLVQEGLIKILSKAFPEEIKKWVRLEQTKKIVKNGSTNNK